MAIPALMVFSTLTLPARIARRANVAVASLYVLVTLGASVGETWAFYLVGSGLEAVMLLLIIRYAWSWPRRID